MTVDYIITTAVAAAIGIMVKALFDMLADYIKRSESWRESLDRKIDEQAEKTDLLMDATQATMRATLIHNAEKYIDREWITPEERASWCDMHVRYSALGANGLIETYRAKIDGLQDRLI